jgi:signal transduction histidine kinase
VALNILKTPELLVVHYRDDGKGFNQEYTERDETAGTGLYNIHSRINSINGRFSIQSEPGKGMEAEIVVKIKAILR